MKYYVVPDSEGCEAGDQTAASYFCFSKSVRCPPLITFYYVRRLSVDEAKRLNLNALYDEILEAALSFDQIVSITVALPGKKLQDITESIASIFFQDPYLTLDDIDRRTIDHPFLSNSNVFEEWYEEYLRREMEDAQFGTYEDQHRLRIEDVL